MNILFLNYEFPPLGGGAATATYHLFKEFSRPPHNDTISIDLYTASSDKTETESFSDNITIHKIDVGKKGASALFQKTRNILRYFIVSTFKTLFHSRKKKYHVTVAFFALPSGVTALLLKKIHGIPYVVSLRGSDVPGFNERFGKMYPFIKPIFKLILINADRVVTNSHDLRRLAQKTADVEIHIIPNGVDINIFKPGWKKHPEKKSSPLTIMCVARLIKRKRVDTLIRALAELENIKPGITKDIRCVIAGGGKQKKNLKQLAQKHNVHHLTDFKGSVDREKLVDQYRDADIFVLPSVNEGMSNALLEAMASGLAIVSTNTGGVKDFLDEHMCLFEQDAHDELAEHLHDLYHDHERRQSLQKRSREIAETLSWKSAAEDYLDHINHIYATYHA